MTPDLLKSVKTCLNFKFGILDFGIWFDKKLNKYLAPVLKSSSEILIVSVWMLGKVAFFGKSTGFSSHLKWKVMMRKSLQMYVAFVVNFSRIIISCVIIPAKFAVNIFESLCQDGSNGSTVYQH